MRNYKYTFVSPLTLKMEGLDQTDADKRLGEFIDKINQVAYEMNIVVEKGREISCTEIED